ncbi:iron complex transport system substrate-binding protein [Afipia massiliensis]|uniref:Iron complex transport system substrate-binding protein n=1 Tax=Afipia massiliensis TaxID=211460 RepID=A0A840MVQ2_9BRAD|nr:hemin ABC transporter substrate-binding protein [Afipia massiliensis]MBB5050762.1 iron complex transport system substrate-binding protein [Afipia massiliensis]
MPAPRTTGVLLGVTLALAAGLCVSAVPFATARAESIVVHDARGRDVAIGNRSRIVSIGGAITEILYALGLEERIVGVDTTSLYPPKALGEKPNVGYMRQLSAEGVLGLNPQLILAIEGSGPKETLDVLDAAKIPFVSFPETYTEQGLIDKIKMVAHAMDADARGACLTAAVSGDLAELKKLRDSVKKPARVMFVMSFLNGRAMVAGHKTAANEIIKLAGGVNAVDGFEGYKPVNDEAIVAAKPDVILTMQRGREQLDAQTVFANPSFALTPAAAKKSFVAMDGLYLLGFGPRTAAAARDLALSLYPDLTDKAATWKPATLTVDCHK